MKRIPLRVVADDRFPPGSEDYVANAMNWAEVVRQVIRKPLDLQKGADMEEIRRGIRILDALDKGGQTLELEDADYDHLVEKVKAMQWGFVDRRIMQFVDDVTQAADGRESRDGLVPLAATAG